MVLFWINYSIISSTTKTIKFYGIYILKHKGMATEQKIFISSTFEDMHPERDYLSHRTLIFLF